MTYAVAIDPGNYTAKDLGVAIVDAINNKITTSIKAPIGAQYLESNYIAKTYNLESNRKDATSNETFEIYTDAQLKM